MARGTIRVEVSGVEETQRGLQEIANSIDFTVDNVGVRTQEFVKKFWKPRMPVQTGFLKNTATALLQRKGQAIAFSQTALKKSKGYAIFPERRGTRPFYTERALNAFRKKYEKDVKDKIGRAIKKR